MSRQRIPLLKWQDGRGPAGLDIPELPETADDDEIFAALASLEAAKNKISADRKALAEKAQDILLSYSAATEEAETGEMTMESADQKSADVKEELKTVTGRVAHSACLSDL